MAPLLWLHPGLWPALAPKMALAKIALAVWPGLVLKIALAGGRGGVRLKWHVIWAKGGFWLQNGKQRQVLRMGFAAVVAAVLVEAMRFGKGTPCLQFPRALARKESRRAASPKEELDEARMSRNIKVLRREFSIVETLVGSAVVCLVYSEAPN